MNKVILVFVALILLSLIAGGAVLATWDIPPPSTPVEKVLPNDRFSR